MNTCSYHPDKKASATCPNCGEPICDRCRLNGTSQRCGACETMRAMGMDDEGNAPKRVHCTIHLEIPTDQYCSVCKRPYCPQCINSGNVCLDCALKASMASGPRPAGPRPPGAPKPGGATGRKPSSGAKGKGKGKGKKGKGKKGKKAKRGQNSGLVLMVIVLLLVLVGGVGLVAHLRAQHRVVHVDGPLHVAFIGPSSSGVLKGNQVIKLRVASAPYVARVELTVDGKYWDRLRKPPFRSDWQTALFPNGRHEIVAKAIYLDRRFATAKLVVKTSNPKL